MQKPDPRKPVEKSATKVEPPEKVPSTRTSITGPKFNPKNTIRRMTRTTAEQRAIDKVSGLEKVKPAQRKEPAVPPSRDKVQDKPLQKTQVEPQKPSPTKVEQPKVEQPKVEKPKEVKASETKAGEKPKVATPTKGAEPKASGQKPQTKVSPTTKVVDEGDVVVQVEGTVETKVEKLPPIEETSKPQKVVSKGETAPQDKATVVQVEQVVEGTEKPTKEV